MQCSLILKPFLLTYPQWNVVRITCFDLSIKFHLSMGAVLKAIQNDVVLGVILYGSCVTFRERSMAILKEME